MKTVQDHCLTVDGLDAAAGRSRPWAPETREEDVEIERAADHPNGRVWCMAEVDIFCHLNEFRVAADGRALTTAIVEPGTIFGEMMIVGQQMHDSFAEAMGDVVVCAMSKADVKRLLLGDVRIATRISETLGRRLGQIEQRLSDSFFKSVPERVASTLAALAAADSGSRGRGVQVKLTHEQLAALVGTSRETTTKILNEYADQGLLRLGRGRITILDLDRMRQFIGE